MFRVYKTALHEQASADQSHVTEHDSKNRTRNLQTVEMMYKSDVRQALSDLVKPNHTLRPVPSD